MAKSEIRSEGKPMMQSSRSPAILIATTSFRYFRNWLPVLFFTGLLFGQITLRQAGAQRGLLMGAAADASEETPDPLTTEPLYAATLGTEYSVLEPENAMKWANIHPAPTTYSFDAGDALVAFAQAHQMQTRGHNLCWTSNNPDWINTLATTAAPAAMSAALQDHIHTVVTHYKGQVFAWDVVNEAVSDTQTGTGTVMKDAIWYNQPGIGMAGTGYVEQALRWAHVADPAALLFYNDYGIEDSGPKFNAVVKDFVARGVPITGEGIQMHIDTTGSPSSAGLTQNMQQLIALGLQVHITEMDVRVLVDSNGNATMADLQAQAQTYQRILTICLQNPGCTAFQTWGFSDARSWILTAYPGFGDALPFDVNYQPKLAFNSIMTALQTPQIVSPTITLVQNAFGNSSTIAPNTWVVIKGSALAPAGDARMWQTSDFVSNQMPTALDGVSVTMNGENAFVYYISPAQLNVLTPPDLAPGPVQVQVTVNVQISNVQMSALFTVQAQMASLTFSLFNGGPYVVGSHLNGSIIGPPALYPNTSTPAQPGEVVVLYANGFGTTSSPIVDGSEMQSGILPATPVVQIGGASATVQFAGLISPGLYQFNVVVPRAAANGDNTLTAQYQGLSTPVGVLLTVQSNNPP